MRDLTRVAVSVFDVQIGSSTLSTCAVVTSRTNKDPMTGSAYVRSVETHWASCFVFLHDFAC